MNETRYDIAIILLAAALLGSGLFLIRIVNNVAGLGGNTTIVGGPVPAFAR